MLSLGSGSNMKLFRVGRLPLTLLALVTASCVSAESWEAVRVLNDIEASGGLRRAKNLTQEQLNMACGDDKTVLPDGLTIKPCLEW